MRFVFDFRERMMGLPVTIGPSIFLGDFVRGILNRSKCGCT